MFPAAEPMGARMAEQGFASLHVVRHEKCLTEQPPLPRETRWVENPTDGVSNKVLPPA